MNKYSITLKNTKDLKVNNFLIKYSLTKVLNNLKKNYK